MEFIASERASGSDHWRAVAERCETAFAEAGFTVSRQTYATGMNIVGELAGSKRPDELVMASAHYDSVAGCTGADDNASGVAGLWRVARAFAGRRGERTLVLACWDEEERGLLGSKAFVHDLDGTRVVAHTVLEMIGFRASLPRTQTLPAGFERLFPESAQAIAEREWRGDFIALIADEMSSSFALDYEQRAAAIGLPTVRVVLSRPLLQSDLSSPFRRSDHAPFWAAQLPSVLLTDTAEFRNGNYHCARGPDAPATLDYDFAVQVVDTATAALQHALAVGGRDDTAPP
ncbi:MAG TPA: M28 family peptidase [Polyangiaceae bacterium]|nr:M28 family peptidase [Polyangiaceae bacterium]